MIQIDIEMPKRCAKCNFCIHQKTNDYGDFGECLLQHYKKVDCLVWSRDSNCPLKEQEPILDKIKAEIEKWHKEGTNWSDIRLMEIENIVNEVQGRK